MLLKDKVTVITGASQGIGLACAERFVKEGAKVVMSDVQDDKGQAVAEKLGADYVHCNVQSSSDIQQLLDKAVELHGRIDSVIANAGIVHAADILDLEEEDFDRVISINLRGVFLTGQLAAKIMINQQPDDAGNKGTIINMSSVNGVLAIPAIAPYVIAKGGVNQWTKCLGIRLASEGVRVNGIGPGSINTDMFQAVADNPRKYKETMSRTPMQRPGEPDEVAKVAVFLASEYSSYVTGQTVYTDGGRMGLNYVVPVPE